MTPEGTDMSFQAVGIYVPQAPAPNRNWCPTQEDVDRCLESTKGALNRQLGNEAKGCLYSIHWTAGEQELVPFGELT